MDIESFFSRAATKYRAKDVKVVFREFTELKHTWSRENGCLEFRVSDYLDNAPDIVLEGMAEYLVGKAHGRDASSGAVSAYHRYVKSKELWGGISERYLGRSRAISTDPVGAHRDLRTVFSYVNVNYFGGRLRTPTLAWVRESPATRFGYFFPQLDLLAVNRITDAERVPRYVLEFVVYHELLHHVNADNGNDRRRLHHTKEFREQERRFSAYAESEKWLQKLLMEHRAKK